MITVGMATSGYVWSNVAEPIVYIYNIIGSSHNFFLRGYITTIGLVEQQRLVSYVFASS